MTLNFKLLFFSVKRQVLLTCLSTVSSEAAAVLRSSACQIAVPTYVPHTEIPQLLSFMIFKKELIRRKDRALFDTSFNSEGS